MSINAEPYDALLVVAFGGPEGPADVMPFLENVTRGRNIPRERLLDVAEHYQHFGGKSPMNDQVRELIGALQGELDRSGIGLPIYWGNRNWHPMLPGAMRQMSADGVRHALAVVLAAYSSYSSCRQYRENIEAAREATGTQAPRVDKLRVFYNHPDFIAANAERVRDALPPEVARSEAAHFAFTAHSIPDSMAWACDYEKQLTETCRLVSEELQIERDKWQLVYQSRSGRPEDPWLGPDILDHLRSLHERGIKHVVVHPVGFLSDHVEVLYDLDEEAQQRASALGMRMTRARTVGSHPRFVRMLVDLIRERINASTQRAAIGQYPANHDVCPADCCPAPRRPAR